MVIVTGSFLLLPCFELEVNVPISEYLSCFISRELHRKRLRYLLSRLIACKCMPLGYSSMSWLVFSKFYVYFKTQKWVFIEIIYRR